MTSSRELLSWSCRTLNGDISFSFLIDDFLNTCSNVLSCHSFTAEIFPRLILVNKIYTINLNLTSSMFTYFSIQSLVICRIKVVKNTQSSFFSGKEHADFPIRIGSKKNSISRDRIQFPKDNLLSGLNKLQIILIRNSLIISTTTSQTIAPSSNTISCILCLFKITRFKSINLFFNI